MGGLQYVTITRPELSYVVNKVCQYMHHPKDHHWHATKRILRYLAGTVHFSLHLTPSSDLHLSAFCDSDWGSDVDDCKSTSGNCIYLGNNMVFWFSRSSTEAEYKSIAAAAATAELSWLSSLLHELHLPISSTLKVFCDNLSGVLLAVNPILHSHTKHF